MKSLPISSRAFKKINDPEESCVLKRWCIESLPLPLLLPLYIYRRYKRGNGIHRAWRMFSIDFYSVGLTMSCNTWTLHLMMLSGSCDGDDIRIGVQFLSFSLSLFRPDCFSRGATRPLRSTIIVCRFIWWWGCWPRILKNPFTSRRW